MDGGAGSAALASATVAAGAASGPLAVYLGFLRGHGELAIVRAGRLYLAGGAVGAVKDVGGLGTASNPQWSHDGQWLAYTRTASAPSFATQLWVVRANGDDNHRIPVATARTFVAATAGGPVWAPQADVLATSATTRDGQPAGLWVATPDQTPLRVRLASGQGTRTALPVELSAEGYQPMWAPRGERLAYAVTLPGQNPGMRSDALYTQSLTGAPVHHLVARHAGVVVTAWWPNARGLLYWTDPSTPHPWRRTAFGSTRSRSARTRARIWRPPCPTATGSPEVRTTSSPSSRGQGVSPGRAR